MSTLCLRLKGMTSKAGVGIATGQALGVPETGLDTNRHSKKHTLTEVFECYSRLQNLDSPVFMLIRVSSLTGGNARYHQGDNVCQHLATAGQHPTQ